MAENFLNWVSLVIVILGALVMGLEGLSIVSGQNLNPVNLLLGQVMNQALEGAFYLLVGVAGLYQAYFGYELYQVLRLNRIKEKLDR